MCRYDHYGEIAPQRMSLNVVLVSQSTISSPSYKLHQLDVESLHAVRTLIGESFPLMMDVNCAWCPEEALKRAHMFAPEEPHWLEEPLWPPEAFEGLARLGYLSGIPIATGENTCTVYQFRYMLDAGAATFIQPSVTKVGVSRNGGKSPLWLNRITLPWLRIHPTSVPVCWQQCT